MRHIYFNSVSQTLVDAQAFRRGPLTALAQIRQTRGDLVAYPWPLKALMVFHPEDIREVLVTLAPRTIKGAQTRRVSAVLGDSVFTTDGEIWKEKRRRLNDIFQVRALRDYAAPMTEVVDRELARWPIGEAFSLSERLMALAFGIAGQIFFGGVATDLVPAVKEAVEFMGGVLGKKVGAPVPLPYWVPTPTHRRFLRARRLVDGVVYDLIRARRAAPAATPDFLAKLLQSGRSDREVRDEAVTMMLAGFETTATMLQWTFYLLGRHPEVAARVEAEALAEPDAFALAAKPSYLRAVFQEALRLYPPSPILTRQSTQAVKLGGREIPAGTNFIVSQFITQRDARFWPEPDRFRPERFQTGEIPEETRKYAYFPFALGPRKCIGEEFTYHEAILIVGAIYRRFRLHVDPSERRPAADVIVRLDRPLQARVERR